jgi:hypothetical protein
MEEKANSRGHSSTRQAAQLARDAGVGRLVITQLVPATPKEASSYFTNAGQCLYKPPGKRFLYQRCDVILRTLLFPQDADNDYRSISLEGTMDNFQKDIDDRANLTLSNRFELLLFRLGTSMKKEIRTFGINVFKLREIVPMPDVHPSCRDETAADGDGEYSRSGDPGD